MPRAVRRAYQRVHDRAASRTIGARMFNYAYYSLDLCTTCSPQEKEAELGKLKTAMGQDFDRLIATLPAHEEEVRKSAATAKGGDLMAVRLGRSAVDSYERSVYLTCVDYTKAVMLEALGEGMDAHDLRFFVTGVAETHAAMCPERDGRAATLPRPVVHTMVAYRFGGNWWLLNVEDPNAEPTEIGREFPERMGETYQFAAPALVANKTLNFLGTYEVGDTMMDPYAPRLLQNIAASGRATESPEDFVCR